MATLRKRNDQYQVQVRRKGYPPITRTFLQKSDALAWARQTEAQLDKTGLPVDTNEIRKLTLGNLVERYLAEVTPGKRCAANEAPVLRAFLRQSLCQHSLATLTPKHFATYRDKRLAAKLKALSESQQALTQALEATQAL
jgi:hypothetical protein